jgi:hypothetical protein
MGRRRSAFGAALVATNNLFDSIGDELRLPLNRDEWDQEDYEDERDAIGRKLVALSGTMAQLRGRLRRIGKQRNRYGRIAQEASDQLSETSDQLGEASDQLGEWESFGARHQRSRQGRQARSRSQLSPGVVLETDRGTHAVVVPLESGVFLVAEAQSDLIQQTHPERVSRAIQESARSTLLSEPGRVTDHWTRQVR